MKKLEKCLCVHLLQDALLLLLNPFQRIMLAAQPVKQGLVLLDFLEELMLHLKKSLKYLFYLSVVNLPFYSYFDARLPVTGSACQSPLACVV